MNPEPTVIPLWHPGQQLPAPRLYNEFAAWWPVLSSPDDYTEEAEFYFQTLVDACTHAPATLLELGSGGGNNASHLKAYVDITLLDLSSGMLDVSRRINPECDHVEGDMRSARLGREFDCVFIHDAINYMTTEDDLRRAVETATVHCATGGAVLFVPDHTRESFKSTTGHGGRDAGPRSLRYLQWEWDPDPEDNTYLTDFVYLLRDGGGDLHIEFDRHVCGLFSRKTWLQIFEEAGITARVQPFEHSEIEPGACDVFVGRKDRRANHR